MSNSPVDYERFWKGYWNDATVYGSACRHRRRIVRALIQSVPHESVLDLGCGDGSLLHELAAETGAALAGSDVSAEALEIARENVPGAQFFQLDLMRGVPDTAYEVIILSEVLEHIEDDEHVLKAIAPYAKHIVVSVPGSPADKVDRRYGHFRNYSGNLLSEKLARCGYETVSLFRWGFPFYDLQQRLAFRKGQWGDATMSEGRFGPLRRLMAHLTYLLYFLNSVHRGQQVFAVARSRAAQEYPR